MTNAPAAAIQRDIRSMMTREGRESLPDPPVLLVLVAAAFAASAIGGVVGFGAGLILLPIIAWAVGVKATAPILTVTMLFGNLGRIWWSRHDIDRAVVVRFLIGAVPATALGATLYAGTTGASLGRIFGVFLIAAVPLRHLLTASRVRMRLAHFPALGAVVGTVSGLVVTTGPMATPFFLAYGLRKGGYVATEAVCALAMHLARGAAFARLNLLPWDGVALGAILGATMFAGSWVGRRVLDRMSDRLFLVAIELLLVVLGLHFLLVSR